MDVVRDLLAGQFDPARRRFHRWLLCAPAIGASPSFAQGPSVAGRLLRVGPNRDIRRIADAARLARNGDTVEIDAGSYRADVATWTQSDLTVRGIGGRAVLDAAGTSAEGKAIFVTRGQRTLIENVEFRGTPVADRNGAGIRLETGSLTFPHCAFLYNDTGLMTANSGDIALDIQYCEFAHNGIANDTLATHQLYVGSIGRLTVWGCYFHHGLRGHLLKSRARTSMIQYSRLTDEGGQASYELEFANGGEAYVIGNLIEQSPATENFNMVSYGAEAAIWSRNLFVASHNTLVNRRLLGGRFFQLKRAPDLIRVENNLLVGPALTGLPGEDGVGPNPRAWFGSLADTDGFDFRLRAQASVREAPLGDSSPVGEWSLRPRYEYRHPLSVRALAPSQRLLPGALHELAG